jgi:hypothetical protein
MNVVSNISLLSHNIDKLYYSVQAGLYTDALLYAKKCSQQFSLYKNHQTNYIGKLYDKYVSVLMSIKEKLLTEFNPKKEETMLYQLKNATELIELLEEKEKFLRQLCDKIASNIPDGPFSGHYEAQLGWIFRIINDVKYKSLKKFNFDDLMIEAWADKIRDLVLAENNLSDIMLKRAKEIQKNLNLPEDNDIITVSFDIYCSQKMNDVMKSFNMIPCTLSIAGTTNVYECFVDFYLQLTQINKASKRYINARNLKNLLSFLEIKIKEFLTGFYIFFEEKFPIMMESLLVIKNTFEYFKTSISNICTVYPDFNLTKTGLDEVYKNIKTSVFNHYNKQVMKLLEKSLTPYMKKSFIGSLTTKISKSEDDVSPDIYEIGKILSTVASFDEHVKLYLITHINKYYKDILDVNNLPSIEDAIFKQIIMDIYFVKKSINDSSSIFTETENRAKFLQSDILNEKIYIEQFKTFYQVHNLDMLKKILKFKNIDNKKVENLIKLYQ